MTNKKNHFKLWEEIARTGWDKGTVLRRMFPANWPENKCFACEEAIAQSESSRRYMFCQHCPVVWPNEPYDGALHYEGDKTGVYFCEKEGSPYNSFDYADSIEKRKQAAAKMIELPWME